MDSSRQSSSISKYALGGLDSLTLAIKAAQVRSDFVCLNVKTFWLNNFEQWMFRKKRYLSLENFLSS